MIRYTSGSVLNEPNNALKNRTGDEASFSLPSETLRSTRPSYLKQTLAKFVVALGPTLVLVSFAALFYFGHKNDWRIPKFGSLTGTSTKVVDDWCDEHSVPESICVECDPGLLPKGPDFGWCEVHGVHNCTLHHPEIAQLKVPATTLQADLVRVARALSMSPRKANNSECKIYQSRIQFASVESAKQAGVDVEIVDRRPIVESIRCSGSIIYDPTRKSSLASRVAGSIWSVEKNVGDIVSKGELLAIIDAAEVGALKTALMRSLAERKLQQQNVSRLTLARDAVPGARIIEAEAALSKAQADLLSAEQSLKNLGLPVQANELQRLSEQQILAELRLFAIPDSIRSRLNLETSSSNLMPILSPLDGVVIDRTASAGEVVDPARILFQVADVSRMWLTINVPLESMNQIAPGQSVRFHTDGNSKVTMGAIDWISTSADKTTRMVQARASLDNQNKLLRNETFGSVEVLLRSESDAIVIPSTASHWEGCCQVVFVRDKGYFDSPESPKVFHVRTVRIGANDGKYSEILSGVLPGEVIATAGSDVLKAQLLKNNLGAGCDCCAK